ncbi:MAG TPA: phosphoribosyltransferase family protein [Phnomibacter sp.]|nr:phosphoribosyltransferase family protein [Phnomibacter sp.]
MPKKYILDGKQADLKIKRMAFQVLEENFDAGQIILAGIAPNGSLIAEKLKEILQPHFAGPILMQEIQMDKKHPEEIFVSPARPLDGNVVVIVDDVANSGRTLTYAIRPYLDAHPKSIQTLVLVDRTHKKFPIQPDYVGLSLASTLQEYIDLDVENGEIKGAWMQ